MKQPAETCAAVAMLRGINVGGHKLLPMAELKHILMSLGVQDVQTYIQSGNAVFCCSTNRLPEIGKGLTEEIRHRKGDEIRVLIYPAGQYNDILAANPLADLSNDSTKLHAGFLLEQANKADHAALARLKRDSEQFYLGEKAFYLYAPEGIGKSKLAAGAEKAIGVAMTMRNWKTACTLRDMLANMHG